MPAKRKRAIPVTKLADGYTADDVGNADRLVALVGDVCRWVDRWHRWAVYDAGRWIEDAKGARMAELAAGVSVALFELADVLEDSEAVAEVRAWAYKCRSAGAITRMVELARGKLLVDHEAFDCQPYLFNVRNGTLDLRTGELLAHDPDHLLTKLAPVDWVPDAAAPLWEQCLERWHPHGTVRAFLQLAAGSALTGRHVELLIINVGSGANGKSKFYRAMSDVLGPYYVTPHKSLLVEKRFEEHQTVVASLFGARMVVAAETAEGDRLNEAQIKNLTGGDRLSARRMREDEWSFSPTWTAFMHTNHRPRLRGDDDAIWRRVRLVEWETVIPETERDPDLSAKLQREAAGILRWLVEGAQVYLEAGLPEPPEVVAATADYRVAQDVIGRFLADECVIDPKAVVTKAGLFDAYVTWCKATGERAWTAKTFGQAIAGRGFDEYRSEKARSWLGIGLLAGDEDGGPF